VGPPFFVRQRRTPNGTAMRSSEISVDDLIK